METRRGHPNLSEKPEGRNGRHDTSCRDADGKSRQQRFTSDCKESEQIYRPWVIEHYDDAADIVIGDELGFKGDQVQVLPYIANAFIKHDEGRVRPDGAAPEEGNDSKGNRGFALRYTVLRCRYERKNPRAEPGSFLEQALKGTFPDFLEPGWKPGQTTFERS